jgi:O-succinylbenzoic acid--CoA ligase
VIEWLRRADPERVFLRARNRVWTYKDATHEVEKRLSATPRLSIVTLDPVAIFDLIAGMSSGGITVVGTRPEATTAYGANLVVFTSGTTGSPKGVRLTRLNLTAAASSSAEHLGHGADDDWLLAMPMHHVGGVSIVVRQAFTGGSITMLDRFDADAFAAAMVGSVTMVSVVPTMLARLVDRGPFSGLRAVLVGGGPIPRGLLEAGAEAGLPVLPTYGMTETFGQVATLRPGSPLAYKAHPLPGVEFDIGRGGRIAVKGPQVSPGYAGEPDRGDPWFVTGDLGEIDDDGALHVLGRADTVIISGGENVNPERIETILRSHEAVDEAVVVGIPDSHWGELVVCGYTGTASPEELRSWVSARVPDYMVPRRFVPLKTIPRTAIGKPDRLAVESLL